MPRDTGLLSPITTYTLLHHGSKKVIMEENSIDPSYSTEKLDEKKLNL
ncbi:MAG: hypothetical protein KKD01_17620 [Proteobacteria bacterium]|nr:hypothetical protein [Pseudomonadota bacterium]MBU1234912.1 hypothetical protein [Pseudomonadota bacterium]MBU1420739.1 hypothetical protein [Pseudomonadota bacterium]MBU1456542.1 hypothetical protein [Pseudomonadota bacterium]